MAGVGIGAMAAQRHEATAGGAPAVPAEKLTHRCRVATCRHVLLEERPSERNWGQVRVQCGSCRTYQTVYLGGYRRVADDEQPANS
jgi:hypothetical protein